MSPLDELARFAAAAGLDFIVCGGHAVNAYNVMRKTGDLDLVIRERDVPRWRTHLAGLGYSVFHEDGAFVQLSPPTLTGWPVDLLIVDDATLDTMRDEARSVAFGAIPCLVPSLEHLITMKLHALHFSGESRTLKDAVDIVELTAANGIDLGGETFRVLCDRFADARVRERILRLAGKQ